jgi:hypothetical protein
MSEFKSGTIIEMLEDGHYGAGRLKTGHYQIVRISRCDGTGGFSTTDGYGFNRSCEGTGFKVIGQFEPGTRLLVLIDNPQGVGVHRGKILRVTSVDIEHRLFCAVGDLSKDERYQFQMGMFNHCFTLKIPTPEELVSDWVGKVRRAKCTA